MLPLFLPLFLHLLQQGCHTHTRIPQALFHLSHQSYHVPYEIVGLPIIALTRRDVTLTRRDVTLLLTRRRTDRNIHPVRGVLAVAVSIRSQFSVVTAPHAAQFHFIRHKLSRHWVQQHHVFLRPGSHAVTDHVPEMALLSISQEGCNSPAESQLPVLLHSPQNHLPLPENLVAFRLLLRGFRDFLRSLFLDHSRVSQESSLGVVQQVMGTVMERRAHLLEVLLGVHLVPNGVVEPEHRGRVIPFLERGIGSTLETVAVEDEAEVLHHLLSVQHEARLWFLHNGNAHRSLDDTVVRDFILRIHLDGFASETRYATVDNVVEGRAVLRVGVARSGLLGQHHLPTQCAHPFLHLLRVQIEVPHQDQRSTGEFGIVTLDLLR